MSEDNTRSAPLLNGKAVKQDSLPFPAKKSGSIAGRTMQESVYSPKPVEKFLPEDAPNILIVLIDDAGPGLPTTFGGEVTTRTLDRVFGEGITYNRFHTTAMCSPTRASLLTGRNHHRVGNGQIAELANDWDGYSGHIPKSSALVAKVLKDYGYSTAAFGKWHNTAAEETTMTGPFDGCPKDRFSLSRDGEPGHNYLCPGLELFFRHTRPAMSAMAELLKHGRAPYDIMALVKASDERLVSGRATDDGSRVET